MDGIIDIPLSIGFDKVPVLARTNSDPISSVDSILELIVFTPRGSFSADPEFGFEYWNHEFSNIDVREFNSSYLGMLSDSVSGNGITRKECEDGLRECIETYVPSLIQPEVRVELEVTRRSRRGNKLSKYEMRVVVTGSIDEGLGINRMYEKRIAFLVEPVARKNLF